MKAKLLFISILLFFLSSCGLGKYDEDYYYKIEEEINGISVSCYGKGYGKYGTLLETYSTNIEDCFTDTGYSVQTGSTDANNATYNELYLEFILNDYVGLFSADFEILKKAGLSGFKISYTDLEEKETSLTTSFTESASYNIEKEINKITIYFKGYKFYPDSYSSLTYKDDIESDGYSTNYKGKQINNVFTVRNAKIEK